MKVSSETMVNVAGELLAQNNWGEEANIQYLGWMTRPGERPEGSILIEFTSPIVANRAIATGVVWGRQIHHAVRFCREGRTKLCRKCQRPGHIQSHCSSDSRCGHCADGHLTWECPSAKGSTIPVKCTNCRGGHRPTSRECPVKARAMEEAKQALANSPAYHRVPAHLQMNAGRRPTPPTTETTQGTREPDGLYESIHAPEGQRVEPPKVPQVPQVPVTTITSQSKRGPGRPEGAKNKPKADTLALVPLASQRTTRLQCGSKRRRLGESDDTMDEQPDGDAWLDTRLSQTDHHQPETQGDNTKTSTKTTNRIFTFESSPPAPTAEAATTELDDLQDDPNDEMWHEASERSEDEHDHH
ncbi:hypothetical protein N7461_002872 [Penicillium sp. DV-2018c]|nr:hypothetical protein N7461_002872 [Penicillium sp. DV-2018c]